jgi:hypothetical protein
VADAGNGADPPTLPKRFRLRHAAWIALIVAAAYGLLAYIILPALWTHPEHQEGLANLPMVTLTGQGIPGDAINVGLIGGQRDVVCAMHAAGWFPADPITLRSSIEIVGSVLLDRQYREAPVSDLYYLGRREDLAFEKPAGKSADHRKPRPVLESTGQGRRRPVGMARRRDLRSKRRHQRLYRRSHAPYRRRYRYRTRPARGRSGDSRNGGRKIPGDGR